MNAYRAMKRLERLILHSIRAGYGGQRSHKREGAELFDGAMSAPRPRLYSNKCRNDLAMDGRYTGGRRQLYQNTIEVEIGGEVRTYSAARLRDSCCCADCCNSATRQRSSLFNRLPDEAFVAMEIKVGDRMMWIRWGDGHVSSLPFNALEGEVDKVNEISRITWDRKQLTEVSLPKTSAASLSSAAGISKLAEDLYVYGVAMVTSVEATTEATREVGQRLSTILDTFYGSHWTFGPAAVAATAANTDEGDSSPMEFADTAYSTSALGPHTDGTYFSQPPAIQVFHCLKNECVGGETLLVDGYHVVDRLKIEHRTDYDVLCGYEIEHRYMDEERHLSCRSSVIKIDPYHCHPLQIRFNPYDRALQKAHPRLPLFYAAYHKLHDLIDDPLNAYWLRLEPGQVLFIDNWRVLHGRSEFEGRRSISGCYLQRDDWLSKLRTGRS